MVEESITRTHTFVERVPSPAEIARDIVIAAINRSGEYSAKIVNADNSKGQVELIAHAYGVILRKVKEEGIE